MAGVPARDSRRGAAREFVGVIALAVAVLLAAPADAQTGSGEPIRLLVGFATGGGTDTVARIIAEPLARKLGSPVVVENRVGGGGVIATSELKRSRPDGRTLQLSSMGTLTMLPHLQQVPFDIQKDFTWIGTVAQFPLVVVVPATLGVRTLAEFVQYARQRPGTLSYSSAGVGTGNHFAGEILKHETGIDIAHVPYKSDGAAIPDLIEGRVAMHMIAINTALPHVRSGRLVALAVTGPIRAAELPGVPTVAEAGFPSVEQAPWSALIGPAAMAPETVARLAATLAEVLADPDVRKRMESGGQEPAPRSAAETRRFVAAESERYKAVAVAARMTTQ